MRLAVLALAMCLAGCGYMGEPLPPALNRPVRVQDLAAVQRGSKIIIQFTVPTVTTEDIALKKGDRDIELRLGPPSPGGFDMQQWERTSDRIPVVMADKQPLAHLEVPAAKYYGKTLDIAVSVHGPGGRTLGWSQFAIVQVVPELPVPQALETSNAPDAVHLEWHAGAPEFRIFRKLVAEVNWAQIATSTRPSYTDNTIEYGKTYQYMVQSVQKTAEKYAESELSDVSTIRPVDTFAPAVPSGVTAVPGTRSIELVWDRNIEKDFATYRIYRDGKRVADGVTAPSFSDRDVQAKTRYQYQVSSVDNAGNESARSPAVEATIP
jgi:hypothetical protein